MGTSTGEPRDARSAGTAAAGQLAAASVAVLVGGRSSEREVSLTSGRSIVEALESSSDGRGPRRVRTAEVTAGGAWRVDGREGSPASALEALADVDVFFLGLHGGEGEGGIVQGLLRSCDRAFTGSDVDASALCLDKTTSRIVAGAHGLHTARGVTLAPGDEVPADVRAWPTGWVVKPRRGGSSVGVRVVRDAADLEAAAHAATRDGDDVLLEALVPGTEATCAVVGNPGTGLRALPVIEIRPHAGRFFDYEEKYSEGGATELCPPETLDEATCERIRSASLTAYRALGCAGYARADWMVPADGGAPVFLEMNTLPGFTPRSLVPLAARVAGQDFRDLCLEILALGIAARRTPR